MEEEEKRVPNYNPEEDDKEYIGTKLLDGIERGASSWYKDERTLEGWEYLNPFSVATAGAIRGVEGVGWVLGNTPVAGDLLRGIGWAEDRLAEGARNVSGVLTPNLDPRFAGWGTRLGTAILADKGIRKVAGATKATLKEGAERAAVRSGKKYTSTRPETMSDVWRDDLAGPRKTYERTNKKRYYPENPPDDPWLTDEDIARQNAVRIDVLNKMIMRIDDQGELFDNIKNQAPVPEFGPLVPSMHPDKYKSLKKIGKDFEDYTEWDVTELQRELKAALQTPGGTLEGSRFSWQDPSGRTRYSRTPTEKSPSRSKYTKTDFYRFQEETKDSLTQFYKHLTRNEIENHHVNTLDTGVALHENLNKNGRIITRARLIEKSGIASGNDLLNSRWLPKPVHKLMTDWVEENVGAQASKVLGKPGSSKRKRWVQLPVDHPERLAKIDEYGALIRASLDEMNRLLNAYTELTTGPITEEAFEFLIKRLGISPRQYDVLIGKKGELPKDILKDPEFIKLNQPKPEPKSIKYPHNVSEHQEALKQLADLKESVKLHRQKGSGFSFSTKKDPTFKEGSEYKNVLARIKALEEFTKPKQQPLFDSRVYRTHN